MPLNTVTTLIMLVAAVLPGYVVQLVGERLYLTRRSAMDAFERLLHSLYYSAFIWAAVVVLVYACGFEDELLVALDGDASPHAYAAVLLAVGATSVVVGVLGARWHRSRQRARLRERVGGTAAHGIDSAWEWAFQRSGGKLIRIILEDGSVIGGPWDNDAFASYTADGRDIFLAEPWALDDDGWFVEAIPNAAGTWIRGDQIARVEFHRWPTV